MNIGVLNYFKYVFLCAYDQVRVCGMRVIREEGGEEG